jgi:hypothetical protein
MVDGGAPKKAKEFTKAIEKIGINIFLNIWYLFRNRQPIGSYAAPKKTNLGG